MGGPFYHLFVGNCRGNVYKCINLFFKVRYVLQADSFVDGFHIKMVILPLIRVDINLLRIQLPCPIAAVLNVSGSPESARSVLVLIPSSFMSLSSVLLNLGSYGREY